VSDRNLTAQARAQKAIDAKAAGEELTEAQYRALLGAVIAGELSQAEFQRFLVAAQSLSLDEVVAIAKVRAELAPVCQWSEPIVVDKHSLGGVPGNRITLIVVPIVAAYGLAMPKVSSRAITSAAGTADAMDVLARVDLTLDEMKRVVAEARGSIAWTKRVNHSALDDIVNTMTRPLKLDMARWSIASILSKKVSAGTTHLVVDLPCGAFTKLKTRSEADQIAKLFMAVGKHLGITVDCIISESQEPVGIGIGPALEVRDALSVLDAASSAPPDLRAKALRFAGRILSWAPAAASEQAGLAEAERLLRSGAARAALERIVELQGRRADPIAPARLTAPVKAAKAGRVASINGWSMSGLARLAGAPADLAAGVYLHAKAGDEVFLGDTLYEIHANDPGALAAAQREAERDCGVQIG
jgi:thymidine phosphorylase